MRNLKINDVICNSFYASSLKGKRIAILSPHEDDEINLAGNSIINFIKKDAEIYVIYSTNGDYLWPAKIRYKEARKSLSVLGVRPEHIFFLGYGDTYNNRGKHIFYSEYEKVTSIAGYGETYAPKGEMEYSYRVRGSHSDYCYNSFKEDLKTIILQIMADIIICVDFDEHADHRALTLAFDKVMEEILKDSSIRYNPMILKRFAYSCAYSAVSDFLEGINVNSTKRPQIGITEKYDWDIIDKSFYDWEKRVRFPVPRDSLYLSPHKNRLMEALSKHCSQGIARRVERIINSDEVFWERRTDSISYKAEVFATSGEPRFLNDFKYFDVLNIDLFVPKFSNYLWIPEKYDDKKEVIFRWNSNQNIEQICIYGNIENSGKIENIQIFFDNLYIMDTGSLLENGKPLIINVTKENVREIKFKVTDMSGIESGIAEIEVFSKRKVKSIIEPFVKITIHDDFAYTYKISADVKKLPIDLYFYKYEKDVTIQISQGKSIIKNGIIFISTEDKEIMIQAIEDKEGVVLDQIKIVRGRHKSLKHIYYLWKIRCNLKYYVYRSMNYIRRHIKCRRRK